MTLSNTHAGPRVNSTSGAWRLPLACGSLWRHHSPGGPTPQIPATTSGRSKTWALSPHGCFLNTNPAEDEGPGFHSVHSGRDPSSSLLEKERALLLECPPGWVSWLYRARCYLISKHQISFSPNLKVVHKFAVSHVTFLESTISHQCLSKVALQSIGWLSPSRLQLWPALWGSLPSSE